MKKQKKREMLSCPAPISSKCLNQDSSSSMCAKPITQLQCQDPRNTGISRSMGEQRKRKVRQAGYYSENAEILMFFRHPGVTARIISNPNHSLNWGSQGTLCLGQHHFKSLARVTLPVRGSKDPQWAGWCQEVTNVCQSFCKRCPPSLKFHLLINCLKISSIINDMILDTKHIY